MWLKPKRLRSVNRPTLNPPLCEMIPTLPASRLGSADLLQVGRVALDRVQDAHAVRTAQRNPGLTANGDNSLLERASFRAALGEATVINHHCECRDRRPQ